MAPALQRYALSEDALEAAGFGPGERVVVGGVTGTMPSDRHAATAEQVDNGIASDQAIELPEPTEPAEYPDTLVASTCVGTPDHVTQPTPSNESTLNLAGAPTGTRCCRPSPTGSKAPRAAPWAWRDPSSPRR